MSAGQKKLTLVDMSSAFIVFGLGVCLSTLVFIFELVFFKIL